MDYNRFIENKEPLKRGGKQADINNGRMDVDSTRGYKDFESKAEGDRPWIETIKSTMDGEEEKMRRNVKIGNRPQRVVFVFRNNGEREINSDVGFSDIP